MLISFNWNGKNYVNWDLSDEESVKTLQEQGIDVLKVAKEALVAQVKMEAYRKLLETDWIVVKCTELGKDPSQEYPEVMEQRQAIRDWCNQKEEEINNVSYIDKLLQLDIKYK